MFAATCILIHITMTTPQGMGEFILYADGHATVYGKSVNETANEFVKSLKDLNLPLIIHMNCGMIAEDHSTPIGAYNVQANP